MEDHKQSRTHPTTEKGEKVLNLTEDMELEDQSRHKILELTEDIISSDQKYSQEITTDTPPPSKEAAQTDVEMPEPEEEAGVQAHEEETADTIEEEIQPPEAGRHDSTEPSIEDEVDAAFEAVQGESPFGEDEEKTHDRTFNKLTGITEMVDDAVRKINEGETPPSDRPEALDEEALATAAAELDAAIEGGDEEDDAIEMTDIVDPSEVPFAMSDDDDIIDLVDIVDPKEIETDPVALQEDEELIELEDIVHPDELASEHESALGQAAVAAHEESSEAEQNAQIDTEEELALSDLDDFEPLTDKEREPALEDDFNPTEIDDFFNDDGIMEERGLEAADQTIDDTTTDSITPKDQQSDYQEELLQLSDILNRNAEEKSSHTDEVISEVKDGIVQAPFITEAEDMADTIGSDIITGKETGAPGKVPKQEIEEAVEYILQTKYADTIERLVADAVEKAVTREIENIKRGLSSDDGNPKK